MKVIKKIEEMKTVVKRARTSGKSIGLVPTMGFLHLGHLSLVKESVRKMDLTVVSIFVNSAQFGPQEDFLEYPRDVSKDLLLLEKEKVEYVFIPEILEMYPEGYKTYVEVHELQDRLCGISRPIFFRGICSIVLKLFIIVNPDMLFFGQKDAQQAIILERMIKDLNLDVKLEVMPIIREKTGLALSSRNYYFDQSQKQAALCLWRSLKKAEAMIVSGEKQAAKVINNMKALIESEPKAKIDYIEVVDPKNLNPVSEIQKNILIAVAVFIDGVRLIDNLLIKKIP